MTFLQKEILEIEKGCDDEIRLLNEIIEKIENQDNSEVKNG